MSPETGTTDQRGWTVAGFSHGGTSAVQFGSAHPELLGSFLAMSPQVAPSTRPVTDTIRTGSRRDRAAYNRASPLSVVRARTPSSSMCASLALGATDARHDAQPPVLAAAAIAAGVTAGVHLVPHGAHDRHTAAAGLARGLGTLVPVWGAR